MYYKNNNKMEPRIKQRYHFAASAFVRLFGNNVLNNQNINQFCIEWAHTEKSAPLDNTILDQYFYQEFKAWRGQ